MITGKRPRRPDPGGLKSRLANRFAPTNQFGMGIRRPEGTEDGNGAAHVAQGTGPNQQDVLGVSVTPFGDETAVHLDGRLPQDDDSIFVTDQTPKPPSDSDSSGTPARAGTTSAIPGYEVVQLGSGDGTWSLARQV